MKKALLVGINDYPMAPLKGCINDASAMASIIETNGDGSPNFDVRLYTDVYSKSELKGLIRDLFTGDCDSALFYFSGHGFINDISGYIVLPDFLPNDEGISFDEILSLANSSEAKNKIIILDCCHSGAFGSPNLLGNKASHIADGVTILTASKGQESAMEVNGHGVFTNLLLDALQGGAADIRGHITPGSVYSYIDQALGPWGQRPVFKTNISRFMSIRVVTPLIPIEVLRMLTTYFPTPEEEFKLDPTFEDTNTEIAIAENVSIFKHLQKYQSVGIVVPVDEDYMYYAAMNSKSCKLTALGYHYWRLVKEKRI